MSLKEKINELVKLMWEAKRLNEWGIARNIEYQIRCYETELRKEKVRNEKKKL